MFIYHLHTLKSIVSTVSTKYLLHRNVWQVVFATLYDTKYVQYIMSGTRGVLSPRQRKSELGAVQENFDMRRRGRPGMKFFNY
jgi:hypothetical protein